MFLSFCVSRFITSLSWKGNYLTLWWELLRKGKLFLKEAKTSKWSIWSHLPSCAHSYCVPDGVLWCENVLHKLRETLSGENALHFNKQQVKEVKFIQKCEHNLSLLVGGWWWGVKDLSARCCCSLLKKELFVETENHEKVFLCLSRVWVFQR